MEVTASSIKTFLDCPRKYYLAYVLNQKPIAEKAYFREGNTVHDALANFYQNKPFEVDLVDGDDKYSVRAKAMVKGYTSRYAWDEFEYYEPEQEFSFDFGGVNVRGKKDAKLKRAGDLFLLDYKTTSESDLIAYSETIDDSIQTLLYLMDSFIKGEPIKGVLYRLIHKSLIRQKKDEGDEDFNKRMFQVYQENPDKYFHEVVIRKSQADIEWFMDDLLEIIEDMKRMRSYYNRNLLSCRGFMGDCEFLPLCQNKQLFETNLTTMYKKKERTHEELSV